MDAKYVLINIQVSRCGFFFPNQVMVKRNFISRHIFFEVYILVPADILWTSTFTATDVTGLGILSAPVASNIYGIYIVDEYFIYSLSWFTFQVYMHF